jgi:heme-degrading monooxygenase HmoA
MHALFFEVTPRPGHEDHYFKIAAALRPILEQNKGLIFIDRYKSLGRPGTILSHSLWADEASLVDWRNDTRHQGAQKAGREVHFSDYRLRIAQVIQGFTREDGGQNVTAGDDAGGTPRRLMAVVESDGRPYSGEGEAFLSVNRGDIYVTVMPIESDKQGGELISAAAGEVFVSSARLCLVSRDYGMVDRREAPQTFAPLKPVDDIAK